MNVAVGGTNGWFPDGAGDKPWLDHSQSTLYWFSKMEGGADSTSKAAMADFAYAQDDWYATWPKNIAERAMVVDSVKMWQRC